MDFMQQKPAKRKRKQLKLNTNNINFDIRQAQQLQRAMFEYAESISYLENHPMFQGNFYKCIRVTTRQKQTNKGTVYRVECGMYTPHGFIPNSMLSVEAKSYEEAIINLAGIVKLVYSNFDRNSLENTAYSI